VPTLIGAPRALWRHQPVLRAVGDTRVVMGEIQLRAGLRLVRRRELMPGFEGFLLKAARDRFWEGQ
jgi:hypothetical protein